MWDKFKAFKWQIIGFIGFVTVFMVFMVKYGHYISLLARDPELFRKWIEGYGSKAFLMYILIQIIQVVVFIIPGEVVQIAGGYIYGTILGSILSVIGITIGSLICFEIARILGYSALKKIISPDELSRFDNFINNPKGEMALFLLFLIPGMPKDILSYIAGITPISLYKYLTITFLARLPGIVFSSYIGANLYNKNYVLVISVSAVAIGLFVLGVLKRDYIMERINKPNRQ
ncbi:Uncharacterized membrane protein YdjX, TVP38/TMEM64 family, SNARE-associated domain [Caldanaerobius fijiensis DSM 17918]|uniref:TVP38/TMEM64 family membrane protein n=1 Tax=Caldanaerobius fijiensis DSM 17918 TaxID=1121256 RepID=A0A1M5EIT3_9THEO|nr:TVP38/TMEM64 family protein [Caldanaerobius fijiensis]SHF79149.1 Uncharacterized membrane protein YdjX, TVP38/TMEM64 family, SNARE-associated domain [Caldanaerobius fijiensis DSM 17918]